MSLSSILSGYGFANSKSSSGTGTQAAAAAKTATAKIGSTAPKNTVPKSTGKTAITGDTAVISAAALAKADNAKDFGALSREVRSTLDRQYAAGRPKSSPDLSGMTGRALAAVALDKTNSFTGAETAAARTALRDQERTGFTSAMAKGGGMSGLATYSKQVVSRYDAMSDEERQARGWTNRFRGDNATFVSKAAMPSLFDQLG